MAFAIVQKELTPPGLGQLQRAFSVSPDLTGHDARTVLKDAYGILLRGLDQQQAGLLHEALAKEQVETEVVPESELPTVPTARLVRHIDFQADRLGLYDPMQRPFSLVPAEIMFLAAGKVRVHEFHRVKDVWEEPQFHGPGVARDTVSGVRSREQSRDALMLEVLLIGGKARYSVLTDELDFAFLSGRRTTDASTNFNLLVRELAAFAPNAGLNRGAFQLTQTNDDVVHYPSKAAFFEEITWMLWRIARMTKAVGS